MSDDQRSNWQLLFPSAQPGAPPLYVHQFHDAYEAYVAAGTLTRIGNLSPPGQAKVLCDLAARLALRHRDELLDQFCDAWISYRRHNAKTPQPPAAKAGPLGSQGAGLSQGRVQEQVPRSSSNAPPDDRGDTVRLTPEAPATNPALRDNLRALLSWRPQQ